MCRRELAVQKNVVTPPPWRVRVFHLVDVTSVVSLHVSVVKDASTSDQVSVVRDVCVVVDVVRQVVFAVRESVIVMTDGRGMILGRIGLAVSVSTEEDALVPPGTINVEFARGYGADVLVVEAGLVIVLLLGWGDVFEPLTAPAEALLVWKGGRDVVEFETVCGVDT